MKHIVIIGNGISGITAARHIRKKSDHQITVISAETDHFYSRTALMYIYMGQMKFEHTKPYEDNFWQKNKIDLVRNFVKEVEPEKQIILFENGESMGYDDLVIATGSSSNKFGWPGQELNGVQGLYNIQDLELMETNTSRINRAVVVGGGLIGIEMVEMLQSRNIPVTFLVREKSFWDIVLPPEESSIINQHIREHHVDLRLSTSLKSINDDGNGNVKSLTTEDGEQIDCEFVGLTVGVHPNIGFLKNSSIATDKGVLVNEFLITNYPNIYAIGDCAQFRNPLPNRRAIEQVWYTGRMMGEVVARTICEDKTAYKPGIWFNSAKFFDIEYQTYGNVSAQLKENESQFYWEHANKKKCIKFVFDSTSKVLTGINVLGIRLRHKVFDQWLREERTIDFVISNLKKANFDPEFFKRHEREIAHQFEKEQTINS